MFAELALGLEVVLLAQGNSQPTLKKAKKKKKNPHSMHRGFLWISSNLLMILMCHDDH